MSDARRVALVASCCVVAAMTPFIAGVATAPIGVVPVAYAIWLVRRSSWSAVTRVLASAIIVIATAGLVLAFLILATAIGGD